MKLLSCLRVHLHGQLNTSVIFLFKSTYKIKDHAHTIVFYFILKTEIFERIYKYEYSKNKKK